MCNYETRLPYVAVSKSNGDLPFFCRNAVRKSPYLSYVFTAPKGPFKREKNPHNMQNERSCMAGNYWDFCAVNPRSSEHSRSTEQGHHSQPAIYLPFLGHSFLNPHILRANSNQGQKEIACFTTNSRAFWGRDVLEPGASRGLQPLFCWSGDLEAGHFVGPMELDFVWLNQEQLYSAHVFKTSSQSILPSVLDTPFWQVEVGFQKVWGSDNPYSPFLLDERAFGS